MAAWWLIVLFPPCVAPRPAATGQFARVDLIVINRYRDVHEWEEENWRHEMVIRRKFSENWWVSFWDVKVVVVPGVGPVYVDLIDRGWWHSGLVQSLAPCSDGVAITSKPRFGHPGMTVIARELRIIDSPYDWEVRNRRIYRPLPRSGY